MSASTAVAQATASAFVLRVADSRTPCRLTSARHVRPRLRYDATSFQPLALAYFWRNPTRDYMVRKWRKVAILE
jgi:hypothetical protein